MMRNWSPLSIVYLLLALVGLVGTAVFNIVTTVQGRNFFGDLLTAGPAVTSLNVDLLVAAVAGAIFIIVEARRLGMPFGWLYVVGALVTAFAFVFPLFLAMRQRQLDAQGGSGSSLST